MTFTPPIVLFLFFYLLPYIVLIFTYLLFVLVFNLLPLSLCPCPLHHNRVLVSPGSAHGSVTVE